MSIISLVKEDFKKMPLIDRGIDAVFTSFYVLVWKDDGELEYGF